MVSLMDTGPDSDLIAAITPDVMTCFRRSHFFERLDDLLCPTAESGQREVCGGEYKISKRVLEAAGFDSDDLKDMFAVLRAQGACCDCEVFYNVAEPSRLNAEYWKRQAHGMGVKPKHAEAQMSAIAMLRQLALATWCETRHFEKTALRFACPELQIVLSVSLDALPRGVFKVIEDDITGNRLFA
jgi:Protein of unknown function (DUF2695)